MMKTCAKAVLCLLGALHFKIPPPAEPDRQPSKLSELCVKHKCRESTVTSCGRES